MSSRGAFGCCEIMTDEVKTYRVSLWEKRKPSGPPDSQFTTGSELTAWHSIYKDLVVAGDGSWGKIEQLHDAKPAIYVTQKDGKGYPVISLLNFEGTISC